MYNMDTSKTQYSELKKQEKSVWFYSRKLQINL